MSKDYPRTPDGRYFVVRGRLWRASNLALDAPTLGELVGDLMQARGDVGRALKAEDAIALKNARSRVDTAKRALGERGPVWWTDGTPDMNRRMAKNTPYADWFAALDPGSEPQAPV